MVAVTAADPSEQDFADLFSAIAKFRARPKANRSQTTQATDLIKLGHARDLLDLEFSVEAAAFSATEEYNVWGSTTPIDWIRHNCRMGGSQAADRVAVGDALIRLPRSGQAVESGEIGFAHLVIMARTEQALARAGATSEFDETSYWGAPRNAAWAASGGSASTCVTRSIHAALPRTRAGRSRSATCA